MVCVKCGAREGEAELFDAIASDKIVKICQKCNIHEQLPILRRPKQPEQAQQQKLVAPKRFMGRSDISLRDLVDKTYKHQGAKSSLGREDLIHNFHWVIMRARRARGVSATKFAQDIGESVQTIELAERGYLPENDIAFLRKVENALRVKLINKSEEPVSVQQTPEEVLQTVVPEERPSLFARLFGKKKKKEETIELSSEITQNSDDVVLEDLK